MMRGLVIGVLVLGMATVAIAEDAAFMKVKVEGSADPAVTDLVLGPEYAGGPLTIEIELSLSQAARDGTAPYDSPNILKGAEILFFGDSTISVDASGATVPNVDVTNYEDGPFVNSNGWDPTVAGGAIAWPAGNLPFDGTGGQKMGTSADAGHLTTGCDDGFFGRVTFNIPAAEIILPTTIDLGGFVSGNNGLKYDIEERGTTSFASITITPEPVSALLLLGALPLLRRRR
jgi:hypothetical protein